MMDVYDIEFTCSRCEQVEHIEGNVCSILGTISESGWPICPECGEDMGYGVNELASVSIGISTMKMEVWTYERANTLRTILINPEDVGYRAYGADHFMRRPYLDLTYRHTVEILFDADTEPHMMPTCLEEWQ